MYIEICATYTFKLNFGKMKKFEIAIYLLRNFKLTSFYPFCRGIETHEICIIIHRFLKY